MNNPDWLIPNWPAPSTVHSASTLRTGGVSNGAFSSFNLALHVGDEVEQVKQNRALLRQALHLPNEPVWLQQHHGNTVLAADRQTTTPLADASYTAQAGVVCAVMTADCLPLLICSTDGCHVAAIHAGWRGLQAGIIKNTLALLPKDILVWLGPAIGAACFEVGDDVRTAFLHNSTAFESAFQANAEGKWQADIYQLARVELAMLGVEQIYGGGLCTVTDSARFFSYRREQITGRMATLIWRD